jgi:hypothetical protein
VDGSFEAYDFARSAFKATKMRKLHLACGLVHLVTVCRAGSDARTIAATVAYLLIDDLDVRFTIDKIQIFFRLREIHLKNPE